MVELQGISVCQKGSKNCQDKRGTVASWVNSCLRRIGSEGWDEGSNPGKDTFLLETIGKKKARLRRLQKRSTKRSEAEKRRSDRDEKKSGPEPAVLITSHQSVGPVA